MRATESKISWLSENLVKSVITRVTLITLIDLITLINLITLTTLILQDYLVDVSVPREWEFTRNTVRLLKSDGGRNSDRGDGGRKSDRGD